VGGGVDPARKRGQVTLDKRTAKGSPEPVGDPQGLTNRSRCCVSPRTLLPEEAAVWCQDDAGFLRLFDAMKRAGIARCPSQSEAAVLALRSSSTFKRDFRTLARRSWSEFVREWRLQERMPSFRTRFLRPSS
jgi:hypothetical protein